ncbi:MAG: heavy metal translocating P-type ATPase metal-binding domain-containing protein [Rhodocyclaceae bacterium]|nr:heavy metal translocating P-type ATPase metal-binding domain-containing protein [Rhodocyclaceae bacterium]
MGERDICDLCGLEIGARVWTVRRAGEERRFCCEGCKGIWQMLNDVGDDGSNGPAGDGQGGKGDR